MGHIGMIFCIIGLAIICLIQYIYNHILKKRIDDITAAISCFGINSEFQMKETLDEGQCANLWNEIVRLEELYIHQKKHYEKQLIGTNQFIENMAHQLKTSLTALQIRLDQAELLSRDLEETAALEHCQKCLDRLTNEVERILNSSLLASGTVTMNMKRIRLIDVIEHCFHALKPLKDQKCVEINTDIPENMLIIADEFWIEQAFENLIKNAIEHIAPEGKISVTAGQENNRIWIRIQDNGNGIDADELPYLFERFHRGKVTKAGYGIGLAMTSDIVKAHHGSIRAGNYENNGAWFMMELPILDGAKSYPTWE